MANLNELLVNKLVTKAKKDILTIDDKLKIVAITGHQNCFFLFCEKVSD